jgi:hypothetical protein
MDVDNPLTLEAPDLGGWALLEALRVERCAVTNHRWLTHQNVQA